MHRSRSPDHLVDDRARQRLGLARAPRAACRRTRSSVWRQALRGLAVLALAALFASRWRVRACRALLGLWARCAAWAAALTTLSSTGSMYGTVSTAVGGRRGRSRWRRRRTGSWPGSVVIARAAVDRRERRSAAGSSAPVRRPSERIVASCAAVVMRKLLSGNGCDIQPMSRWTNMPTRSAWTSISSVGCCGLFYGVPRARRHAGIAMLSAAPGRSLSPRSVPDCTNRVPGAGPGPSGVRPCRRGRPRASSTSKKRMTTVCGRRTPTPTKTRSPIQASAGAGAFEARQAAEVDLGRIDRLAADEAAPSLPARRCGRRRCGRRCGRRRRSRGRSAPRAAPSSRSAMSWKSAPPGSTRAAEAAADAAAADDRDDAAHAGGDLADLDRRADLDLEVGEQRQRRRGERIAGSGKRSVRGVSAPRCHRVAPRRAGPAGRPKLAATHRQGSSHVVRVRVGIEAARAAQSVPAAEPAALAVRRAARRRRRVSLLWARSAMEESALRLAGAPLLAGLLLLAAGLAAAATAATPAALLLRPRPAGVARARDPGRRDRRLARGRPRSRRSCARAASPTPSRRAPSRACSTTGRRP